MHREKHPMTASLMPSSTLDHPMHHSNQDRTATPAATGGKKGGMWRQPVAAGSAAIITGVFITPFDVVKNRLQVLDARHQMSATAMTRNIVSKSGFPGLYRGIVPTLLMQIPNAGFYYTTYEFLKRKMTIWNNQTTEEQSWYIPFLAGSTARVAAAIASNPFEYIRTAIQSSSHHSSTFQGQLNMVRNLLLDETKINRHSELSRDASRAVILMRTCAANLRRVWTGLGATLLRDAPFSAVYWAGYEKTKRTLLKMLDIPNAEAHLVHIVSGGTSGMIAAFITHPIDVIKTRIQSQYNVDSSARSGAGAAAKDAIRQPITIRNVVKTIMQEEGSRGMFRGLLPRLTKVAPSCAIMISSYEFFKTFYGVDDVISVSSKKE